MRSAVRLGGLNATLSMIAPGISSIAVYAQAAAALYRCAASRVQLPVTLQLPNGMVALATHTAV